MRLFKSSNKSQASLDRLTESHDQSPNQPEIAYSQSQHFGGSPLPPQPHPQQHPNQIDERFFTEQQLQTHSAQQLGRSQSSRIPSASGNAYAQGQPTVKIIPPQLPVVHDNPGTGPGQVSNQAPPVQSPLIRPEKEQKKSKRSIFGLGSSKKEEKEYIGDRRSVGRAPSVLRRNSQHIQHRPLSQPHSPQSPQDASVHQFPTSGQRSQQYGEEAQQQTPAGEIEQFYRGQSPQESSPSQSSHPPGRYVEDNLSRGELPITPRHKQHPSIQAQRSIYQVYHQTGSANSSTHNLGAQTSQPLDPNQSLRSPSQASLGAPSPLPVIHPDSRPVTGSTQVGYSATTVSQPPQQSQSISDRSHRRPSSQEQSDGMGRNDASNGSGRQHRGDDERHSHYQSQQDLRTRAQGHEQGRSTPPPRNRDDLSTLDFGQLLQKHEELQQKYSKVKRYYFEREAQVTQLQNQVASQRLSMSKTTLDDAQYVARFERLNGAIQNLSFNIRKDWRRVPNWLAPVCNRDAHSVGMKESTAIGRACITRWLFETLFERVFHPGIDPNLSFNLKNMERSLRRSSFGSMLTQEQQEDLMIKITTWRLTTIESLSDVINSRQSEAFTESLTSILTRQLNEYIRSFLSDPPPPGLAENLYTIVVQAVSIAANIPLESRDICIEYFTPAAAINETYMRLEPGMTPLQAPGSAASPSEQFPDEDDSSTTGTAVEPPPPPPSQQDLEAQIREASAKGTATNPSAVVTSAQRTDSSMNKGQEARPTLSANPSTREQKKTSFLGGFVSKKPTPITSATKMADQTAASGPDTNSKASVVDSNAEYNLQNLTGGVTEGRIRFAAFLAVEVRGRPALPNIESGNKEEKQAAGAGGNSSANGGAGDKSDAASAGIGAQQSDVGKPSDSKKFYNVLVRAPVYCFD